MLTAQYLDALSDPIIDLYDAYMQSVINDIARRLVKMGKVTATAAWQVQRITESGALYKFVIAEIAKLTGKRKSELRRLFKEAGVKSMKFDDSIYKAAGLNPLPLNLSPAMVNVLKIGLDKTNIMMSNLTQTTAATAQEAFINAADLAYMQVTTGAMSYNQAIRAAIKNVADQGLTVIQYPSGRRDQLDVAMRRAVLTGVQQTSGRLQTIRADEMKQDLVQTSAHYGARPTHAEWQGRIFSRSGGHAVYPDFVASTGYGEPDGLCGVNCRHSYFPFIEGVSENAYSAAMRENLKNREVTYKGKRISQYEASQIQRSLERKVRDHKRRAEALGAAGLDNRLEINQVKRYQADLRAFVSETRLKREPEREGGRVKIVKAE